jgi:Leucine-rich repeat (LRR) protein
VLPKLLKLDLSDNKIESGFEAFAPLTELMSLILANNWVKTVDALRPLGQLPELVSIDLF